MKKFGYDVTVWDAAKEEARQILISKARSESPTITYSELADQVRAIGMEPDSHALKTMLGEISTEEDAFGRGMLTVLVVHKGGDLRPGSGFFDLAEKLGRDISDRERCWVVEFEKVTSHWRQHS
jgi:hypothetical protein